MLHEIPDEQAPHAPTTECGCGPQLHWDKQLRRDVIRHRRVTASPSTGEEADDD